MKGQINQLKEAMKQAIDAGMLTFEESLLRLYRNGAITLEEARENADSRSDLSLRVRLSEPLSLTLAERERLAIERTTESRPQPPKAGWQDEPAAARRI
jgi:Tfp pilus assembly ATPase PilU